MADCEHFPGLRKIEGFTKAFKSRVESHGLDNQTANKLWQELLFQFHAQQCVNCGEVFIREEDG